MHSLVSCSIDDNASYSESDGFVFELGLIGSENLSPGLVYNVVLVGRLILATRLILN